MADRDTPLAVPRAGKASPDLLTADSPGDVAASAPPPVEPGQQLASAPNAVPDAPPAVAAETVAAAPPAQSPAEAATAPAPPPEAGVEADAVALYLEAAEGARDRSAQSVVEAFLNDDPDSAGRDAVPLGRRIREDVAGGIGESGTQILGGVRDAAAAGMEGIAAFDEWASDALGLPKLQLLNDQGAFDVKLIAADEGQQADVSLPEIREPKTVTGGLVRGISQFLTGFAGGQRVLGGVGGTSVRAQTGRAAAASAMSDFAAFDAHEERLSNLIQSVPALENPVTEYLASDMDDGELEGRLKNVLEGGISDVAVTALVAAFRGVRLARRARDITGGESYADAARRMAADTGTHDRLRPADMSRLRPPDLPALTLGGKGDADELVTETSAFLKGLDEAGTDLADIAPADAARALSLSRVEAGEGEVFINWGRIETGDDVRGVIQQMADALKGEVDEARRGTRSNAETAAAADEENAWQLLAERRRGQPLNAEQSLALRRLWAASGGKLIEAARLVDGAASVENVFLFRRAMALHAAIQREVIAVRTETARALQQWAIPAGPDDAVARQLSETVDMFGAGEVASDMAGRILNLASEGNRGAIDELTRKGWMAASADAVYEFWVNALLSGPKTHMVNAMSNTAVVVQSQIERVIAAKVGQLRGSVDGVDAAEAGAMLHGLLAALPDGVRFAGRAFVSGQSGFGLQKVELPRQRAISTEMLANTRSRTFNRAMSMPVIAQGINAFGALVSVPGRALGASDEFFKTINYRMEVHAQAARRANQELRAGAIGPADVKRRMAELIEDPGEDVMAGAREFAQYSTFTNDAGRFAGLISRFKRQVPGLRYVAPFVNTPANILRFAAERSPAAPLLADVRADIRAGGARADMAMAKLGLGSYAMLLTFDAAMNGQITGGGPGDARARAAQRRQGVMPNSVKIGDRWFAYNRMDPLGLQMGIAANLAEIALNADENPGGEIDEAIYRAIGAVGQHMLDKSYMQGMSDLFNAMSEPRRHAPRYFERLAGSFVPTFVREIEGFVDPELRRSHDTLTEIRSRIPGLSGDLPVRHDLWGREISYASGLGEGYDAVSPIYSSRHDPQPIDQEFQRLGYFPGLPSSTLQHEREVFPLRNHPEIYERLVVLQGGTPASDLPEILTSSGKPSATTRRMREEYGDRTLMGVLNDIVTGSDPLSAEYQAADNLGRRDMIGRVISDFRRSAKAQLLTEFPQAFAPGTGAGMR